MTNRPGVPRTEGFPRTQDFQANWDEPVALSERQTSLPTPQCGSYCPVTFELAHPSAPPPTPSVSFVFFPIILPPPGSVFCPSFPVPASHCVATVLVPLESSIPVSPVLPSLPLSPASSASLPLLSVTESLSLVSSSAPRALLPNLPSLPLIINPTLKKHGPGLSLI